MWNTVKTILNTLGGTFGLLVVDTFSFCMALRIYMDQSTQVESDIKMMYLAVFFTIIALLSTLKLLSGGGHNTALLNYAKQEGFDDFNYDLEDEEEDGESDSETKTLNLSDSESIGEEEDEDIEEVEEESKDLVFDYKIDFDDNSETLKKFDTTSVNLERASLDLEEDKDEQ